jgi:hypothetical protein
MGPRGATIAVRSVRGEAEAAGENSGPFSSGSPVSDLCRVMLIPDRSRAPATTYRHATGYTYLDRASIPLNEVNL